MPGLSNYPDLYQTYNDVQTKNLSIVVSIESVSDYISLGAIYKRIRYGDPGLEYGNPDLIYGGLVERDDFQPILSLDSNLQISQKVEPEQGRGSVATMSLTLVDLNGYATRLVSPGVITDDILGNKLCKVYLGYTQTSFPEDYFVVFRGYVTSIRGTPTKIQLQLSDANSKRRQASCKTLTTIVSSSFNNVVTTIPVVRTDGFYVHILGPDATYDTSVSTYITVDDEVMEYGPSDVGATSFEVTRAARGTIADSHDINTEVGNTLQLEDNSITIALKMMLSGWNGPWISGESCASIQNTQSDLGIITNALLLPGAVDAVEDYGLVPGDYVYLTGSTAGNDGTYIIQRFGSVNSRNNNIIYMTTDFPSNETPASSVELAFRSKYDVLPILAGSKMKPTEIDVATYEDYRNRFFTNSEYNMQFYITEAQNAKEFIESQIMLPMGVYSITRYGRISLALTLPPIAGEKIITVDNTTVINPESMTIERATNNRKFFNEVQYQYDANDAGEFLTTEAFDDFNSIATIGQASVLPIPAKGVRTSLNGSTLVQRRAQYLVNRYKDAAIIIQLKVNWKAGSLIETGDVVLLKDQGNLHINNFANGTRDAGVALYEVIERSLDIKTGEAKLTLLSNIGYQVDDRFGVISPSSNIVGSSNTVSDFLIEDSYGSLFPGNEAKKWEQMVGETIEIRNASYSYREEVTLLGFDPSNSYRALVSPLSMAPTDGMVMEVPEYPSDTDPYNQQMNKLLWAHWDPSVPITFSSDVSSFDVDPGDVSKVIVGRPLIVHNPDYSLLSDEIEVASISGNTIFLSDPLTFVPSDSASAEILGFPDLGGGYRLL